MPRHDFVIPQLPTDNKEEEKKNNSNLKVKSKELYQPDHFASPTKGTNVKDSYSVYPSVSFGNNGRQYDSFREKENRVEPDYAKEYLINRNSNQNQVSNNNQNPSYNQTNNNSYGYINNFQNQNSQNNANEYYDDSNYDPSVFGYKDEENKYPKNEVNDSSNQYQENEQVSKYEEVNEEPIRESEVKEIQRPKRVNHVDTHSDKQIVIKREKKKAYSFPPLSLLRRKESESGESYSGVQRQREIIDRTLQEFGISGRVSSFTKGPTVTLFEVELDPGVKYARVSQIQDNLQGNLEAISIRIQAPIPGKARVGIEVPNQDRDIVLAGDMISNEEFLHDNKPLNVVLGLDVAGSPVYLDITKLPHALIAGATGSGKSICVESLLVSILYKAHPDDVKLILIDPKKVEFAKFRGIPHLAMPIVTDTKLAIASLNWAVEEMENRYELFASIGASKYTEYLELTGQTKDTKHLPYILIIIDEYAYLVQDYPDVEDAIAKLTAKARAAGIHILVCTQRPSVDVISGTIKSNIPGRIAFKVKSSINSSVILDKTGAEKLLGNGDMLYIEESGRERRIQGAYIDGTEIVDVVHYITDNCEAEYLINAEDLNKHEEEMFNQSEDPINDEIFAKVAMYVVDTQNASINKLQKVFGLGFNRAQGIVQKLEDLNIVSENLGSRARQVLVKDRDELEEILEEENGR